MRESARTGGTIIVLLSVVQVLLATNELVGSEQCAHEFERTPQQGCFKDGAPSLGRVGEWNQQAKP